MKTPSLILLVFASHVAAAPITWGPARDITSDTDVSTNGSLVKAVAKAGSLYPTVNGVTFTPLPGNDTVSGTNASNFATGSLPVGGGISQSYSTLLSQNVYNSGSNSTVTLTVNGLTVGYHYELQVWFNDSNATGQGTLTVKSTGVMDPWAQLDANTTGAAGGKGQHAIGTFTADATSQTVTFQGSVNGMIQAYQVRRVTDPLALVAWGLWHEITGDTDVNTTGTAVKAYVFGSAAPAAPINGVTFTRFAAQSVDTLSGFTTPSSDAFGSASAPYAGFTSDYKKILGSGAYGGKCASLTLNSLTPGQWYEVQVWANDSRVSGGGRVERINGSAFLNCNPGGPSDNLAYEGNTGHHMSGIFQAVSASQRLDFVADVSAQINGLQLRAISTVDPLVFAAKMRRQHTLNSFIDGKMYSTMRFEKVHLLFGAGQIAAAKAEALSASLWWGAGNNYTFDGFPAVDMVIRWKNYIDTASRNAIKGRLPTINYVSPGTANLQKLAFTMRFLASEEFGEGAFLHPKNDFRTSDPNCHDVLLQRLKDEANWGSPEFASNDYGILNLLPSLSISQLAKDPEMRAHATASFPAMLAQLAAAWQPMDNYIGVWSWRDYEDQGGHLGVMGRLLWEAFGSNARSGDAKAMALMVAGDYQAPAPILHAANERTTIYTSRLWGGSASQSSFVSGSDYMLFSACDNDNEDNDWSHPYGVRWTGMSNYFWLGACATDYSKDISASNNHGTNSYNMGTVQYSDSVLYAFDFTGPYGNATYVPYAQSQVPGGYSAMINDSTTDGRIYLHYGKVMIAVTSSIPFTWDPGSGIWSARHAPNAGDSEFRVAVGGVGNPITDGSSAYKANIDNANNRFAMAIETALPSEYAGATPANQLAAFKADIEANTSISHLNIYPATGYYTNRHGDTLQKQSYDASGNRKPGYINGVSVDYTNWPILDNPWMRQVRNSGTATITAGSQQTVLDFVNGGLTNSAVTSTGGPMPQIGSSLATNLTGTSAVCNAALVSSGSSATSVTLYWGTVDSGTNAAGWANSQALGTKSAGAVATTITGLTGGTTYYYRHYASNAAGGAWSNTSSSFQTLPQPVQVAPPGVPGLLSTTLTVGSVPLTWTAIADATTYNIKRATTSGGPYTTIKTGQATASYSDTTAVNGTTYFYVVSAVNTGGESVNSGEVKTTPAVVPAAPAGVTTSMGYMYAHLSWTPSPWAATYTVMRSSTNGGPYTTIASGLTSPSYDDTTAINLSTYYYVVAASNVAGSGSASSQASITVNVASYIDQVSGNWNSVTWYPNPPGIPTAGSTAIIDFGNSSAITSTNNMGNFTLNQMRFFGGGVTLTGSALAFSGANPTVTGSASAACSVANLITLGASTTFDIDTNTITFTGVISSTGGLTKTGAGTLTLGAANTYTGSTIVDGGTLSYSVNNTGLKALYLGATDGSDNVSTLNALATVTGTSLTLQTDSSTYNNINIGAGVTLTINGGVSIFTTGSTGTKLKFNSTGSVPTSALAVSNTTANFAFAQGTDTTSTRINSLDMRNLGTFTANVANFRNGWSTSINYARPGVNTLYLATNNTITSGTLGVGDTDKSGGGGGASTLYLGSGSNAINTNTLVIGRSMSNDGTTPSGQILFNGATGTLALHGAAGGSSAVTNVYLGAHTDTGSANPNAMRIGVLDLTGGTTTGSITNLYVGYSTVSSNAAGNGNGTFLLGGTASSVTVGNLYVGYSTVTQNGNYFGNGEVDVTDGVLNVTGNITMAYDGAGSAATNMVGALSITGGTLSVGGNIVIGGTGGSSSIILNGGTLDMTGGAIGSGTAGVDILNFQSGTLKNVASINGTLGLTQTGDGTLVLAGSNTYTGMTTVAGDTLEVDGFLSGAVTVNGGTTLSGTGTIGGAVSVSGSAIISPGLNAVGTLRINNSLTLGNASTVSINTNRTGTPNCTGISGLTSITYAGTLTVSDQGGGLAAGDTFVLFAAGSYSGAFGSIDLPALSAGLVWDLRNLSVNGSIAVAAAAVVTPTGGSAQVGLSWTAVAGATSYNVKRSLVNGGPYTTVATGITSTSYSDTNLDPSTTYYYTVSAVIGGVEGPDSLQQSAATAAGTVARYWDSSTAAGLQGGTGTWSASSTAWSNSTSGNNPRLSWRDNVPALFQTGTNTATVSGTLLVDSIAQSVNGTVTTISGGSLSLTGANGISNGVGSGNGALTISSSLVLNTASTTINAQQPINLNGAMSGTCDLLKTGTATLTLGEVNTVNGDVTLDAGAINYNGTASNVQMITFGSTLGSSNTAALGVSANVTCLNLGVQNNNPGNNSIAIASGKALAVNGGFSMDTVVGGTANLLVSGSGAMSINNGASVFLIGATSDANARTLNLDLSGLTGGFAVNVSSFYVGKTTNAYNVVPNATIKLAPNSSITAGNIEIGSDVTGNGGNGGGASTLVTLSSGTSYIKTNSLIVGRIKSGTHTLNFAPGGGTLIFSGTKGGALGTMYVGYKPHTGSSDNVTGVADFTNGIVSGSIGSLYVGYMTTSQGSNSPKAIGTFILGTSSNNNLAVTSLNIGTFSGSTVPTSSKYADGTVTINGGQLTVGSITMTSEQYSFARLNINGGTLTVNGAITSGTGANESITLNGGTLDMTGGAIGTAASNVSTLNFQSGTLMNVGSVNGIAGLTKTGTGTLILDGTNSYAGTTTISAGTLQIGNAGPSGTLGTGNVVNNASLKINRSDAFSIGALISGTGTLSHSGIGTTTLSGANTYSGSTTISAGTLAVSGTLTSSVTAGTGAFAALGTPVVSGNFTIGAGASFRVRINGSAVGAQYDQLTVSGTVTLSGALDIVAAPGLTAGTSYTILNKTSAGSISGAFVGKPNGGAFVASGYTWIIGYTGGDGNDVVLTIATPQQSWRYQYFGTIANTGTAADTFDANKDGENNFLEFATGQNPNAATTATPMLVKNGANLEFTYTRSKAALADSVTFVVEWSDTLAAGTWSIAGISNQNPTPIAQDANTETLKVLVPVGSGSKRFVRLRASK